MPRVRMQEGNVSSLEYLFISLIIYFPSNLSPSTSNYFNFMWDCAINETFFYTEFLKSHRKKGLSITSSSWFELIYICQGRRSNVLLSRRNNIIDLVCKGSDIGNLKYRHNKSMKRINLLEHRLGVVSNYSCKKGSSLNELENKKLLRILRIDWDMQEP